MPNRPRKSRHTWNDVKIKTLQEIKILQFKNQIIARSRTTLKQADNAVSAKAQARFSSFTTSSFFREVLTMIADWSDLHC